MALIFINDRRGGRRSKCRRVGKVPDEGHRSSGGRCIFPEEAIEVVKKFQHPELVHSDPEVSQGGSLEGPELGGNGRGDAPDYLGDDVANVRDG